MKPAKNSVAAVDGLYRSVRKVIEEGRKVVSIAANAVLVQQNWSIGKLIVEDEQKGRRKADYGKKTLEALSVRLSLEYGSGYTLTNLKYMRQFYLAFPIGHALRDELGWTHYRILMREDDPIAREWYMNECVAGGWSSRDFDIAEAWVFNLGLHFGTRAAAKSRIAYLREENPSASFRILTCELTIKNPLRVDDIFGHTYGWTFDILEREIEKAMPASVPLKKKFDSFQRRWMNAEVNPRFAKDPSLYAAFNQKLNIELRNLFQKLGYDGFVYRNEIESGDSAADSYCVFDDRQVKVVDIESPEVHKAA